MESGSKLINNFKPVNKTKFGIGLMLISQKLRFLTLQPNETSLSYPDEIQSLLTNLEIIYNKNNKGGNKRSLQIIYQESTMTFKLSKGGQTLRVTCPLLIGLIVYHISNTKGITVLNLAQKLNIQAQYIKKYLDYLLSSDKQFKSFILITQPLNEKTPLSINPNLNFAQGKLDISLQHTMTTLKCFLKSGKKESLQEVRWKYYLILCKQKLQVQGIEKTIGGLYTEFQSELSQLLFNKDITEADIKNFLQSPASQKLFEYHPDSEKVTLKNQ